MFVCLLVCYFSRTIYKARTNPPSPLSLQSANFIAYPQKNIKVSQPIYIFIGEVSILHTIQLNSELFLEKPSAGKNPNNKINFWKCTHQEILYCFKLKNKLYLKCKNFLFSHFKIILCWFPKPKLFQKSRFL